jgi:hypothetical protein
MDEERPTDALPAGMTGRGLRGRQLARWEFVIAIVPAAFVAFLFATAPQSMGGFDPSPSAQLFAAACVAVYLVGLATMIRIYRSDPEAHRSFWRSSRD